MIKKKYLAIIPARKGSKRLPNKNILDLAGKPLIAWTIEAALESKYISTTTVSTDSQAIMKIAKEFGAEAPFIRPAELASDTATSVDVVLHALQYYKTAGIEFDYVVLLQATSPLRSGKEIDEAIELQIEKQANSITSVCKVDHSPLWSNTLPANNSMKQFIKPDIKGKRSQDLDTYYRLNGAIYINKVSSLIKEKSFISSKESYAYVMEKSKSIDIDEEIDFKLANIYINEMPKN